MLVPFDRSARIRELLKQREHQHLNVPEQVAALLAATEGLLDNIAPDDVAAAEETVQNAVQKFEPDLCERIGAGADLSQDDRDALIATMRRALHAKEDEKDNGDA